MTSSVWLPTGAAARGAASVGVVVARGGRGLGSAVPVVRSMPSTPPGHDPGLAVPRPEWTARSTDSAVDEGRGGGPAAGPDQAFRLTRRTAWTGALHLPVGVRL